MDIALTGGSGFIGTRLIERLTRDGHSVRVLGRRPAAHPKTKFFAWDAIASEPPPESLQGIDAVIHLAGEPVAQRWTAEAKRRIADSRILGTRYLVRALSTQPRRPAVLVAGSAVGYYGDRGDEVLTEQSGPGEGFLPSLSQAWEKEGQLAQALGIRVAHVRTGIVLGRGGGALERMLPAFRFGAGARLGSGKQWLPWIHIDDIVELLVFAMQRDLSGPVNGSAPAPVRNAEFTRELGRALGRPAFGIVPRFALKLAMGEMSDALFESHRVIPAAARKAGFEFRFPELRPALDDLLTRRRDAQPATRGQSA